MGKGYRNRDGRDDAAILTKKPKKQKRGHRPLPKWIVPTLVSVIAVVVIFAIVWSSLISNGVFKRNNILVKSQVNSKYNLNQPAAQIIVWYYNWYSIQQQYQASLSSSSEYDSNSEFSVCWSYASGLQAELHDVINDYSELLERFVALCDYGAKNGISFTAEDEEAASTSFLSDFRSQAKSFYTFAYEVGFSTGEEDESGNDIKQKYPADYSTYVDYSGYPYFGEYLRNIFGNEIRTEDFNRAAIILTYANRVSSLKQMEFWNADSTAIAEELKKNPDEYYTLNYLKYAAENTELAEKLKAADSEDAFKKVIAVNYIENNYSNEYSELLAKALLENLKGKTGDTLVAKLEEYGLTAAEIAKPVETTEEAGDAGDAGDAEPGEEGGEPEADPLTKKQSDWLFNKDRIVNDLEVITEADGSSTLLALTNITKDADGNITAVQAAIKNFVPTLAEEELAELTNEVCHHLGLPYEDSAEEAEGDSEEETKPEAWDDLVEALESGAKSKLPTQSTTYYVKAVDLDKDIEEVKTALEEAEDKVTYLKNEKGASEHLGMTEDKVEEELKAVLFPEEGTVQTGLLPVVTADTDKGETKYLVYVTEVKEETDEAGEKTGKVLVSYCDYSVSEYSAVYQKWFFEDVNTNTMAGAPEVGKTFVDKDGKTVYIVSGALGLGDDVVRGGYLSYSGIDNANADLKKLEGLTGIELLSAFADLSSSAVASNKITQTSVSSTDLKAWLFDGARKANDAAVVYHEDEDGNIMEGIYLAVFLYKTSAGESDARSNIASEKVSDFAKDLVEAGSYKLSESALAKIK